MGRVVSPHKRCILTPVSSKCYFIWKFGCWKCNQLKGDHSGAGWALNPIWLQYSWEMQRQTDTQKTATWWWRQRLGWWLSSQGKPRFACDHSELEEGRKDVPLSVSEGSWLCWQLDFRLLASRTVKQNIPVVLSHMFCGTLYQQSQETHTEPHKDSCMREKQMTPVSSFSMGTSGTYR